MILFRLEHVEPILSGRKVQTRRLGRKRWNVGAVHQCKRSYMGEPFARVRILGVWQQPLSCITQREALREGYPDIKAYWAAFARINRCAVSEALHLTPWVVDFELVED